MTAKKVCHKPSRHVVTPPPPSPNAQVHNSKLTSILGQLLLLMIVETKQLRIRIQELLKSIAAIPTIHAFNVASLHTSSRMASLLSV